MPRHQDPTTALRPDAPSDAAAPWRSPLTVSVHGLLLFEVLTGLAIYLLPVSRFNQVNVLTHTLVGLAVAAPCIWYAWRHWRMHRGGNLSHYQLLGYSAALTLGVCLASGLVATWQGAFGPRLGEVWRWTHLISGLIFTVLVAAHIASVVTRKLGRSESSRRTARARRAFCLMTFGLASLGLAWVALWSWGYEEPAVRAGFPADYDWRFGEDRPFSPSLARISDGGLRAETRRRIMRTLSGDQASRFAATFDAPTAEPIGPVGQARRALEPIDIEPDASEAIEAILDAAVMRVRTAGAVPPRALAGSASCGTAGCHEQIYSEWLPSAHRYASLDDMFQRVQSLMAAETTPVHTRYCAGCHDPISLFAGAKNAGNITLSSEGAHEGVSCIVCHGMVQADVRGNADYTLRPPRRYLYEGRDGRVAKAISDFLIRAYPDQHTDAYARPLHRTAEHCGACHKQYVDELVNTDIGKVQGQNQYDSWKNSRWRRADDPAGSVSCRECHMPLIASDDPASGDAADPNRSPDDGRHRSHRFLGANQYIPVLQNLAGGREHARLVEQWLRGEIEIPEIADRWTTGPAVRMELRTPERARPGEPLLLRVVLTNNKAGHDFPTGPLDMIESWVWLRVTDPDGRVLLERGRLDEDGRIEDPLPVYKADLYDRHGEPIDRHNLWDLVGARYKRSIYPGFSDVLEAGLVWPEATAPAHGQTTHQTDTVRVVAPDAEGQTAELRVTAVLYYRKANADFLDRVYGADAGVRSPITEIARASRTIRIEADAQDEE